MAAALETQNSTDSELLSLEKQMQNILEEARMILPGVEVLFGFQLIAAFHEKFQVLPAFDKWIHLTAACLTVLAVGLTLAPAALHRIVEPDHVSVMLVKLSTRLLAWAMVPLAAATAFDFYVFTRVVMGSPIPAYFFGGGALILLVGLWIVWPRLLLRVRS